MKKILVIISWISAGFIGLAMAIASLWVAALIVNAIADVLCIAGTWKALCLTPVLFVSAFAAIWFFLLGIKQYSKGLTFNL